ncbi:MAG: aminotransferase class I/II-fold pyridoxal phosphate-dependent enzyme [Chitinivibrionales bacterium]|nr:aminotransferase class I/II-fold pyridoxal phosphate-dependent enzyme [Chitinivibrionales bacterium]
MISFSLCAQNMRSSEIRRLMKLAADPSIISFAGGMPNNNLFPVDTISELFSSLPKSSKQQAFQYCPTSGYPPLLESLSSYLRSKGMPMDSNKLIITTGAQQAINIIAKVMLDPGDAVLTERPSFIGALAAFKSYCAGIIGAPLDENGIVIKELDKNLSSTDRAKLLYINPNFHNPAGIIYSKQRKEELIHWLSNKNLCLLEDDPYGELYFNDEDMGKTVSIKALAPEKLPVCYTGSFSKILGPGMRLGWLLGPPEIIEKCELAKQSMDACSPTFTQVLAHEFMVQDKLSTYLQELRPCYARRADIMLEALKAFMPDTVSWTVPEGGFYLWLILPETVDSSNVLSSCIEKGAAFVIGKAFDPEGRRNNCLRLAFSHTPEDKIEEGIKIIASVLKEII